MIFLIYLVVGILLNFVGPLAKHLLIENNYFLKENRNKNWFYRYTFIILMRFFMTIIYPIFYFSYYILKRKPDEPVSSEDKLNTSLVKRLRNIGEYNNIAPTDKTSDEKIIEIYTLICSSFRKASSEKQERIPADNLNTIVMKFFKLYEEFGEDFMQEHLEYELKKYAIEGLRPEYKKGISLF
ncbi:hypothetical protein [Flavobacterium sp. M31R6]|uniref:hypothetical protein n=1 Tax=Flavobacterium sp. M31R6 TaxID=2739062 RepID=UPI001569020F|nr:hypothetical protein [Flavobacterium sp. M31R6]QKJ63336.1 hypothetical protein HQN62_09385 [Flavobacterium sp. M31R6]